MITAQDIVLLKSERLTDYDDGGGRVTGQEVVDGVANNLFPDISELDRVYGRVSLRKAFPAVLTDTVDMAYGMHVAITDPPDDGRVHTTMFARADWDDERTQAKDRIESYVISAPESLFVLYGDHLTGQRMVRWYCEKSVASPEVGEVYRLSVERTGYTAHEQYIRIQKLTDRSTQEFTEIVNNTMITFQKDVLLLETSAALRYDFPGGAPTKATAHNSPTKVRYTQVADAARYYGVATLAVAAEIGDLGVTIASPYSALVPSTQTETPLVDVLAGMGKTSYVPSGAAGALTWSGNLSGTVAPGYAAVRYLSMGCAKGSVTVTIGSTVLSDDGSGALAPAPGDTSGFYGSVDYGTGMATVNRNASWNTTVSIAARPAAEVADLAQTREIPVTLSSRGYNYVPNLQPPPAPGTLAADYRALGKWVRLSDNGKGQLTGRTGEGTGTINYATGSVIATLGALPDVDTSIVFSWGTPAHYTARNGDAAIQPGALDFTVEHPAIKPSTLAVTWLQGAVEKTATDNGSGVMSGDAAGTVNYLTGRVILRPTTAPDANSLVTAEYDENANWSGSEVASSSSGTYTFAIGSGHTPLKPGKVSIDVVVKSGYPNYVNRGVRWTDDGAGNLSGEGLEAGGVNYTTGEVEVTLAEALSLQVWTVTGWTGAATWSMPIWGWESRSIPIAKTDGVGARSLMFTWAVVEDGASDTPQAEEFTHDGVAFDLTPQVRDQVMPGSVRFTWANHVYIDRAGSIYRDVSSTTNAGTLAGTIDYESGEVRLTNYVTGSNEITVSSLLTVFGAWSTIMLTWRTPGCPLKPASFSVRATRLEDSAQVSATADNNGDFSDTDVEGHVDVQTGLARVRFGNWVATGSLTQEDLASDWYDTGNIVGGNIFKPVRVIPSTVFFNCVVYSFVPLDASILGIDPVRLPQDGRVPIFRSGDAVLVHHTLTTDVVTEPDPGEELVLRERIGFCYVKDGEGTALPSNLYTVDLDLGILTWANPLDLSAYTFPLHVTHRIEDLLLCSDVQITGELAFVASLTHDFPADETYVSSCLLIGDVQARVEHFHDLQTFTAWSDEPTGSVANSNFNNVLYPVQVTNKGSVEERWRATFTGSTTINVIGETYGQIVSGASINNDLAPTNPQTGVPYFFMDRRGWGGGWGTGNTVRFNTRGANYPLWFVRTTLQGPVEEPSDHFKVQIRADAD